MRIKAFLFQKPLCRKTGPTQTSACKGDGAGLAQRCGPSALPRPPSTWTPAKGHGQAEAPVTGCFAGDGKGEGKEHLELLRESGAGGSP